jgi:hypothetical protein
VNGSNERWIEQDLVGGWLITVAAKCRAMPLKLELPAQLRTLENDRPGTGSQSAIARISALGVVDAHRGGTAFPGSIYVTLEPDAERTGGVVSNSGHGRVTWLDEWMVVGTLSRTAEIGGRRHYFSLKVTHTPIWIAVTPCCSSACPRAPCR